MNSLLLAVALAASGSMAQQAAWAQCGGIGFTGGTTCVSGYTCTYSSAYYSQCIPSTSTTTASSSSSGSGGSTSSSSGKLKWVGASESCAEWGTALPGVAGTDYTFPSTSTIGTLISQGYNIFRVPFAMERMAQGSITASLNSAYLSSYSTVINYITSNGAHAILDPHNYGRYNGAIITDTSSFGTFWSNLAKQFASNANVIFDTNNEYHDMDETLVYNLNQAAITAIRGVGATSQYIFVEGNSWTGAAVWNTTNDSLKSLTDPEGKLIYEMHLYLDSDSSGTHDTCVSTDIGVERAEGATAWLRANGKLGVIGEFAGGSNSVCQGAVTGLLNHLASNNDVWQGALYWAAGPWWGTSWASFEPPSGASYVYYNSLLKTYV